MDKHAPRHSMHSQATQSSGGEDEDDNEDDVYEDDEYRMRQRQGSAFSGSYESADRNNNSRYYGSVDNGYGPDSVASAGYGGQQLAKKPRGELICVVCGAAANGYNFDAITCESCKAFFRRNAFRPLVSFLKISKLVFRV